MRKIFDFCDIENCENTIKQTWSEFRECLAKGSFSYNEIDILFNSYFEYYYHLDIIDNGLYDCYDPEYVQQAQEQAEKIHAQFDFVPGSNLLLEKLVSGRWDEQFLIAKPGINITQSIFFDC